MVGRLGVLKEQSGSKCLKCDVVFFGTVEKCGNCQGAVEPVKWYSRLCLERLLFIATAILASFFVMPLVWPDKPDASIIAAMGILSMYFSANWFFGIGGLKEKFVEGSIPDRAYVRFSWKRYFSEFFRVVGIFVVVFVFMVTLHLFLGR